MKFALKLFILLVVFVSGYWMGSQGSDQAPSPWFSKTKDFLTQDKAEEKVHVVVSVPKTAKASVPVAAPKITQPKAGQIYTVQVASFKELKQARGYVDGLLKKDYDAYIAPTDLASNKGWYRVCIGESLDRAQAKKQHERIKGKFKGSFVQVF